MNRYPLLAAALFALVWGSSSIAQLVPDSDLVTSAAQSALQPQFTPPAPGTYRLPPIDIVSDHRLLDSTGNWINLFKLTKGKVAIISFMYTSCTDIGGCPLAAAVLQQVDQQLSTRPELANQVMLLSISFDPERDTPTRLTDIRKAIAPQTEWRFLTGTTATDVQPILDDFNQPVASLWQEDGQWSGVFRHVLKVFLVDAQHRVRNIYSTGFLNAQILLNDVETILLE